jgi:hypothetical protein
MKIIIRKDGGGYLAQVTGHPHLFAWAPTREGVRLELLNVVEMMLDYHLEQIEIERKVRLTLAAV